MDWIVEKLTNLDFWFTLIVGGIFASIAGNFAYDFILKVASKFSERAKKNRERRKLFEAAHIKHLTDNPTMLVLESFCTMFVSFYCILAIVLSSGAAYWLIGVYQRLPDGYYFWKLTFIGIGWIVLLRVIFWTVRTAFGATQQARITNTALNLLRERSWEKFIARQSQLLKAEEKS